MYASEEKSGPSNTTQLSGIVLKKPVKKSPVETAPPPVGFFAGAAPTGGSEEDRISDSTGEVTTGGKTRAKTRKGWAGCHENSLSAHEDPIMACAPKTRT